VVRRKTAADKPNTQLAKENSKMNAMSRNLIRFVGAPVAAAGILGGAALGFSALANASTVAAAPAVCTYTGNATQCQTPGNVQINTEPGNAALDAAQQQYPFFGYGYEGGLLFHHGGHR
jgi:hypothetical protein